MKPQVLFPFLLPSLVGLSASSVIRSPASSDLSTLPGDLGTRTTKSQTANYLSITAELGPPTRISTSILHQSVASESEEETPTTLGQGEKQAVQPPPGTATDPGAGGEQQPQQPDKPKITHDPLPTEATEPSSNGGGGPKSGKTGAIIGGVMGGIVGVCLLICVFKGIKDRRVFQEENDNDYEMRRQRRRERRQDSWSSW